MRTNSIDKMKPVLIKSLHELRPSLRNQINRTANCIGFLFVLNYFLLLLLFFGLPKLQWFLSFDTIVPLIIFSVFSLLPFLFGRTIGIYMKLRDMGYSLPKGSYAERYYSYKSPFPDYSSPSPSSSSSYFSSSPFGSSSSSAINPSTGLPMTGHVDISGNPYGTNSWR